MKKLSKSQLLKKADSVFSKYIRKKYEIDGFVACVTCRVKMEIPKAQAGHFIRRSIYSLRYSEDNVFPQCYRCNVLMHGNYPSFSLYLIRRFGQAHLEKLEEESKKLTKTSLGFYQEIIDKFS
jgi:hypothetical protein